VFRFVDMAVLFVVVCCCSYTRRLDTDKSCFIPCMDGTFETNTSVKQNR